MRSKVREWKRQRHQGTVTLLAVLRLLPVPVSVAAAYLGQECFKIFALPDLIQRGVMIAGDVVIDQSKSDLSQAIPLAEQGTIDFQLGPVQLTLSGSDAGQIATVGFDLLQRGHGRIGPIAISTTTQLDTLALTFVQVFGLVVGRAPCLQGFMALNTFIGTGGGGIAVLQAAFAGGELT